MVVVTLVRRSIVAGYHTAVRLVYLVCLSSTSTLPSSVLTRHRVEPPERANSYRNELAWPAWSVHDTTSTQHMCPIRPASRPAFMIPLFCFASGKRTGTAADEC
ncbi:hypothetical protein F4859DRAFT_81145 [Xylaria cf. heliscus]|nr:hypothetical protein F4859DRAFT_81145 [Xylaria cf. heliscus]